MNILMKPVITEKATADSELNNRFTFLVNTNVNKIEIKKEVEKTYGVDVLSVKTMIYRPKTKSRHTKSGLLTGKTNKIKKAVVEIAEGQEIDFYGNI
ncbi:MAG: 50S ribosomal protein L23 [Flavobacteriales bacterium]